MFILISNIDETESLKSVYNIDVLDIRESDSKQHVLSENTVVESLMDLTDNFETPFVFNQETNNYVMDIT